MKLNIQTALSAVYITMAFGVGTQTAIADDISASGTGFFVNDQGWVVTNAHVVEGCTSVSIPRVGDGSDLAIDKQNDLAAFRIGEGGSKPFLPLRRSQPRLGEDIAAYGFPLTGVLSDSVKVTTGNINSLVGLENDTRYLQVSTPLQPGNSGGPVVDQWGSIVGVSTAVLGSSFKNATGIDVQNVNFAIRSNVIELFLQSRNIPFETADPVADAKPFSTADLSEKVSPSVVQVLCHGGSKIAVDNSAASAETSAPPPGAPDEDLREAAINVVRSLIEQDSSDPSSSLQVVANLYADTVSYYGKQRSLGEVLADKRDYFKRWPERAYQIRNDSVMVTCANGACMVSGVYDWMVRSIPRNKQAQGVARFSYTISLGANPKIISEAGNVVKQ
ncbi:serine protease [Aminobacter sp. AP02]|uniref:S1 family peptidase n=1 Tax=Aminobacter sp. AP02 TaxID=2135737 RepID=UPI001304BBC8|nr:serine protease [Aminobacter sp. AP02]